MPFISASSAIYNVSVHRVPFISASSAIYQCIECHLSVHRMPFISASSAIYNVSVHRVSFISASNIYQKKNFICILWQSKNMCFVTAIIVMKHRVSEPNDRTFCRALVCCTVFVWFDSLRPINNLSVIKGRVFLGWTSTKLGLMFLLKDTTQWRRWGSNPRPFGLESSTLPLSHCAPVCCTVPLTLSVPIWSG